MSSEAGPCGNWFRLSLLQIGGSPTRKRANTQTHTHISQRQRHRPSSLRSLLPSSPSYRALPSHQSRLPAPPAPPLTTPYPADLFDGSWLAGGSVSESRKLPPRFFLLLLLFRPERLKLFRLASRPQRSAEPIFRFVHQKRCTGLLLRAISSQRSTTTLITTDTV